MTSTIAPVVEAYLGPRVPLLTGKVFQARKPLLFPTALRWMQLLEDFNSGRAQGGDSVAVIVAEMPAELDPVDLTVLDELTLGEVVDVLYRFFGHRRTAADFSSSTPTLTTATPASASLPR